MSRMKIFIAYLTYSARISLINSINSEAGGKPPACPVKAISLLRLVEISGIEPLTS